MITLEVLHPEKNRKLNLTEGHFSKEMRNDEIKNDIDEIKKLENKIKRKYWKCERNRDAYDFQQFETIIPFDDSIYTGKISIDEVEMDQTNLLGNIVDFNNISRHLNKMRYF